MYWLHINGVIHDLRFLSFFFPAPATPTRNVYGLPSAENWLAARSGLKLFYRLAANNTLEAHVGSPAGYTFKFVTQSVEEYLRSYFFWITSIMTLPVGTNRRDGRSRMVWRDMKKWVSAWMLRFIRIIPKHRQVFEFLIYLNRDVSFVETNTLIFLSSVFDSFFAKIEEIFTDLAWTHEKEAKHFWRYIKRKKYLKNIKNTQSVNTDNCIFTYTGYIFRVRKYIFFLKLWFLAQTSKRFYLNKRIWI